MRVLMSQPVRLQIAVAVLSTVFGCSADPNLGTVTDDVRNGPATNVLAKVAITNLAGSSPNAGALGNFVNRRLEDDYGHGKAPALSNTVLSAVPGTPAKPLFVGQANPFDSVLIAVRGASGFFEVPAANNALVGLDMIPVATLDRKIVTIQVATKAAGRISDIAQLKLVINSKAFVTAGDLENHDTAGTSVVDQFGAFLEGLQSAANPTPDQIVDGTDNNDVLADDGVKGLVGPVATGHRDIDWDGVPEVLRNKTDFSPTFFNRQATDHVGVRAGITFTPTGGTGQEVNDAFEGAVPDPATVGPPANDNAPLGGDFSNINPKFAGDLLSHTQSASFATIGTVVSDLTFTVAGSNDKAVIAGAGIVFSSVDREFSTSVSFFDENDRLIAKIFAPVQSHGPFPFPGPASPDKIPYSFVGFVDPNARIARVKIVAGEVPVDQAAADLPAGRRDVVSFDDVLYAEPRP
jgi:hypothetical protein